MKTIYIVRHGLTEWNVQRRIQGRLDSPLTDQGQQQVLATAKLLRSLGGVEHLYVSPSGRTRETAYLLNSSLGATMSFVDELVERDCGAWSGLTVAEVEQRYPAEWEARSKDAFGHRPPEGENVADLMRRVMHFVDGLFTCDHERLAIVTHAVTSRAILAHLLALPQAVAARVQHPNDALYQLEMSAVDIQAAYYVAGEGPNAGLIEDAGARPATVAPIR